MNSYHLMSKPGAKLVKALGGLHGFSGYRGVILTDSGGFQLFSLIRENPDYGEIREKQIIFRPDLGREKLIFTPEKCIQAQFQYGSDIMMALDMCTHPDDPIEIQRESVELTVRVEPRAAARNSIGWLPRKKVSTRPLLFGIVQGGSGSRAAYGMRTQTARKSALTATVLAVGRWAVMANCAPMC